MVVVVVVVVHLQQLVNQYNNHLYQVRYLNLNLNNNHQHRHHNRNRRDLGSTQHRRKMMENILILLICWRIEMEVWIHLET